MFVPTHARNQSMLWLTYVQTLLKPGKDEIYMHYKTILNQKHCMLKKFPYKSISYKENGNFSSVFGKFILLSLLLPIFILLISCSSALTNTNHNQTTPPTAEQLNNAANINIELGMYYFAQKNIPQAQKKFLLALQQSPKNFLAYDAMGYFLENIEENVMAEKYYQQALQIAPANSAAHNNYGTFLYRRHRCQEALAEFTLAVQDIKYLNLAAAYENAGLAALCLNEKVLARNYLKKACLIDPQRKMSKEGFL